MNIQIFGIDLSLILSFSFVYILVIIICKSIHSRYKYSLLKNFTLSYKDFCDSLNTSNILDINDLYISSVEYISFEEFKDKFRLDNNNINNINHIYFRKDKSDENLLCNNFENSLINYDGSSNLRNCIIIRGVGYIPKTYYDYKNIMEYIFDKDMNKYTIFKIINAEPRIDKISRFEIDNGYREVSSIMFDIMEFMVTSNIFKDNVSDMIIFEQQLLITIGPFIYRDENNIVYVHGIQRSASMQLVVAALYKAIDSVKVVDNSTRDIIRNKIVEILYEFSESAVKNGLTTALYQIEPEYIDNILDILYLGVNSTTKKYLNNWRDINFANSYWKALPFIISIDRENLNLIR